ncbi:Multicopper oxidase type 2 [Trinorchestia longiramus]|nr:Multicopper oxidase type 2 [Trinorchestia longiramus]
MTATCAYFSIYLYHIDFCRACYDCPNNVTDCLRPECVTGGGQRRLLTVVNRQMPGPAIEVCHGDRILVEVQNELPAAGVTLHWHGLTMDDDPYMDGVNGLTQCSIRPREKFMYSFKANFPGTHFWHGQNGLQRGDGLYGPLIVRKPDDQEPNKLFYDHDLTAHVLTISDLAARDMESLYTERYFNEEQTPPTTILINGRGGEHSGSILTRPFARMNIVKDKRYRVRIINAAALNCPFRVIAPLGHNFTVISADGSSVSAFYTHSLVVYNGERWDVVLTADQSPGLYWLTVLGEGECNGLSQNVVVSYKASVPDPLMDAANSTAGNQTVLPDEILNASEDTDVPSEPFITSDTSILRANTHSENCSSPNITCVHEMRSLVFAPMPGHLTEPWVEETFFLAFGSLPVHNSHFYSLLYYGPEFMPPKKRSRTPQINNLSLRLPAKPLLLDKSPLKRHACSADGVRRKDCVGDYCECLHTHQADVGNIVELVLINEGRANETLPQPFHLHGHRFWVLGQEVYNSTAADIVRPANATAASEFEANETDSSLPQPSDMNGFTRLHALNMFSNNHFVRNFWHPIMKDTIMIPPGGYTIVRFQAYNKGFWLGESQVLLQSAVGQAFMMQIGNITTFPKPPLGFNSC